jgi:hypothetical protein
VQAKTTGGPFVLPLASIGATGDSFCVGEYHTEQQQTVLVATVQTRSQAEFLQVTLAANGFQAVVSASVSSYPSVDFVQGLDVRVRMADAEAARELLRRLA